MNAETFFTIFFIASFIFIPILLFILVRELYLINKIKDKNVFQYKIANFIWNGVKVFAYLFVIGLVLNIIRIWVCYKLYTLNLSIDLKPSIITVLSFFVGLYNSNLFLFLYFFMIFLLALIGILLFWRTLHSYFLHEIFSLYIYIQSNSKTPWMITDDLQELREKRNNKYFSIFNYYYLRISTYSRGYDLFRYLPAMFIHNIIDVYKLYYDIPPRDIIPSFLKY